jgi:tetratricopeptide (TPR) repeat protein
MKLGHVFRFTSRTLSAIALGLILCGISAAQENPPPAPIKAGSPVSFTLPPGAARNAAIEVNSGEAVTIEFEQVAGSVSVTESCTGCPPQEPRTNAAGIHSTISFRIIGTDAGAASFAVLNPSKTRTAEIIATVSPPHTAAEADRREADAESSFAHAEALRGKRDPASVDAAAAAFDHAIALWRVAGDTADMARALAWKAMLLGFVKNDLVAAQAVAKEALGSVDSLRGAEAANCWKIAGYIAAGISDYSSAEKDYATALALFQATGDRLNQEILLDNMAKLARQQGRSDEALADADAAAQIAHEICDLQRQLSIAEELGSIYTERGELRQAFEAYQQALELLKTTSYGPVEGYVWSDLGVLYTLVHEFDHAREALAHATVFWQNHPNLLGQINTFDDLGELYLEQGKTAQARRYLAQGLEIANSHALPRQQVYLLRAIGASRLRTKDMPGAREALEKALAIASQAGQGDELGAVYCSLGDLNAAQKKWTEAKEAYEKCRALASAAKSQYDMIHAEGGLARAALETGELEDALTHAEKALGEIESVRGHLSEQDLKTSFFASMHDYYDLAIAICMRLDRQHPDGGYAWKAFQFSERARARLLLDQMLAAGVQPSAAADGPGPLPEETSALQPLSLASIQQDLLDPETGLLEYWIGARSSYLWLITRNGFHSYPLPTGPVLAAEAAALRRDIFRSATPPANVAAELREAAMQEAETQLAAAAERAGAALLPPRGAMRGLHRLLVIQDDAAVSVPFAVLRYPAAAGERSAPLATEFAIVAEPSASALAELIAHSAGPQPARRPLRIAIFTNPISPREEGQPKPTTQVDTARHSSSYSRDELGVDAALPPLRFADREAASILSLYGSDSATVMTGAEASPESVKALDWTPYTVGHFATHAIVNQRHAELSGLVLPASGQSGRREGMLWYEEITRLHAPLQLVVLSACDTANGEQVPGEGLLGLSHAFMTAGSERVLGTLWKVDDEATAVLMAHFYRELKHSGSPAEALRVAQARMATDPRWHSPYYWAGFSLEGNWHEMR